MDGFQQASCVARHLSDIYSPIFWLVIFSFLCNIQWKRESLPEIDRPVADESALIFFPGLVEVMENFASECGASGAEPSNSPAGTLIGLMLDC